MPGTPHTCTRETRAAGDTSQCYACQETHGFSTGTPDLAAMTPAEVDTLAAPLETELARLEARQWEHLAEARKARRQAGRFAAERAERNEQAAAALVEPINAATDAVRPFRAEYERHPWPRVFWCTANGGHAHVSLSCRTLHIGTGMVWLPEHSGKTEAELVELAGEAACTVCYPSAPVDVLARPSQLAPAVEARAEKAARDAERAEKAAARDAKAITAADGGPLRFRVSGYTEEIKTERTAWTTAVGWLSDVEAYGYEWTEDKAAALALVVEAIAAKTGREPAEVRAEIEEKAKKKAKRDRAASEKHARSLGLI